MKFIRTFSTVTLFNIRINLYVLGHGIVELFSSFGSKVFNMPVFSA